MAGTSPELRQIDIVDHAGSSWTSRVQAARTKLHRWQDHWSFAYVLAVVTPIAAAGVHHLFWLIGLKLTYVTFYTAIILASLVGGLGPGLVATLLSAFLANYYFLEPAGRFHLQNRSHVFGLAAFSITALCIAVMGHLSRQSRRAFRSSAQELAGAERVAGVGSWRWNVATDKITWSKQCFRIAGIDPRSPAPGFLGLSRFYTQESWAGLQAAVARTLKTGEPYEIELEVVCEDGTRRWTTARGEAERDSSGQVAELRGTILDITERKRAELELLATKDELAAELTAMTRLHQLSTRLMTTTELQPLLEEVLSATIALQNADFGNVQLYEPEARTLDIVAHQGLGPEFLRFFATMRDSRGSCGRALHEGRRVIVEDVMADPDYEPLREIVTASGYRAVQSTPLFTRKGDPLGVISTHFRQPHRPTESELRLTDLYALQAAEMIERKRAEEKLRQQADMLNLAQDAIIITDLRGRILFWNHGAEETYGFSVREAMGRVSHDLLEAEYPLPLGQLVAQAERAGTWRGELRHTRRDGTKIIVGSRWSVQRDESGTPVALLQVNRDVTEQKLAEEKLAQSELNLKRGQAVSHVGSWNLDKRKNELTWSDETYRMFGVPLGTPLNLQIFLEKVHPEDRERVHETWQAALRGGPYDIEHRIVVDNNTRWVRERAEVEFDASGNPVSAIGTAQDITEQKQLEAQLMESQKLEAIGRLAGGVAHDFNNIMSIIMGYAEVAQEKLLPEDPLAGEIEGIRDAAERASGLTRQLLAFSRRQMLRTRVLNLNDVLKDVSSMLGRLIGENIELVFLPGADLGSVNADPAQIEQVMMNLAVNARDAMPRGGKLAITTSNVELDDDYCRQHPVLTPGRYVMISVVETGAGMNQATAARIFEPFFTTKGLGKGTGLGLSIIYGIVRQSKGDIQVESQPGRGTTFRIYLPRVGEQPGAPAAHEHALPSTPPATETVLVVEDEAALAEMICSVLESSGYTVLSAGSGEEALALEHAHRGEIQLLLTDVILTAGMDGTVLADKLQALRPGIKVMFMSGYNDVMTASGGPMNDEIILLEKPFSTIALRNKVRGLLERAPEGMAARPTG
jgi:PAS domain S-box-containing protein